MLSLFRLLPRHSSFCSLLIRIKKGIFLNRSHRREKIKKKSQSRSTLWRLKKRILLSGNVNWTIGLLYRWSVSKRSRCGHVAFTLEYYWSRWDRSSSPGHLFPATSNSHSLRVEVASRFRWVVEYWSCRDRACSPECQLNFRCLAVSYSLRSSPHIDFDYFCISWFYFVRVR